MIERRQDGRIVWPARERGRFDRAVRSSLLRARRPQAPAVDEVGRDAVGVVGGEVASHVLLQVLVQVLGHVSRSVAR